eukprot:scaffold113122_cov45-Phaeocystis_antarctica.AAC.1
MRARDGQPSCSVGCHFSGRRAHLPPYRALSSHAGKCCACDERQLTKVGRGLRERRRGTGLVRPTKT